MIIETLPSANIRDVGLYHLMAAAVWAISPTARTGGILDVM